MHAQSSPPSGSHLDQAPMHPAAVARREAIDRLLDDVEDGLSELDLRGAVQSLRQAEDAFNKAVVEGVLGIDEFEELEGIRDLAHSAEQIAESLDEAEGILDSLDDPDEVLDEEDLEVVELALAQAEDLLEYELLPEEDATQPELAEDVRNALELELENLRGRLAAMRAEFEDAEDEGDYDDEDDEGDGSTSKRWIH